MKKSEYQGLIKWGAALVELIFGTITVGCLAKHKHPLLAFVMAGGVWNAIIETVHGGEVEEMFNENEWIYPDGLVDDEDDSDKGETMKFGFN